jgi:uncharacterized membrane protein
MRKRNTAVICLFLLCALAGGGIWITSNSTAQSKTGEDQRGGVEISPVEARTSNPLGNINDKSRAANSGGETEIRALADEIFTTYGFNEAPAGFSDAIKERLVRSEVSYRSGKGQQGISDASIVRAVNYLAYKVGAPAYARTNVFELRRLKTGLLPYTADLQARSRVVDGATLRDGKGSTKDPKTPTMSPLEATLFMTVLVQQKQFNPEYQLTNEEFVALHGGKRSARSDKLFRGEMQSRQGDIRRSRELETLVEKNAAAMPLSEIVNLPQELMYVLGIEK